MTDAGDVRSSSPLALTALVCAAVPVISMTFWPALESGFLAPKAALLAIVAVAGAAVALCITRLRLHTGWRWFPIAALAYSIAVTASWLFSTRRDFGPHAWLLILCGPLLGFAATAGIAGRQRRVTEAIAFAGGVQAVLAVAQWQLGLDPFSWFGLSAAAQHRMQVFGTLGNPDFVAIFIAGCLPAILLLAVEARGWLRIAWVALAVLFAVAIAGTGCRTGAIGAAVAATSFFVVRRPPRHYARRMITLLVALVIVAACALIVGLRNRHALSATADGRLVMYRVALSGDVLTSSLGAGPGTFEYNYFPAVNRWVQEQHDAYLIRFIGYERTAENDYVQALNETGWSGSLALLAMLLTWGWATWHERRRARDAATRDLIAAALAGVLALAAAAVLESPFQRADTWALLWVWLALPISLAVELRARGSAGIALRLGAAFVLVGAVSWFALQPAIASWYTQRGIRLEFNNHYDEAAAAYRTAIARDRTNRVAHFNLTRTLAKAERYEDAWPASTEALRWDSGWEIKLLRSRICQGQGNMPCALRELTEELEVFPWCAELKHELVALMSRINERALP